jgi:hypothetical protein
VHADGERVSRAFGFGHGISYHRLRKLVTNDLCSLIMVTLPLYETR